MAGDDERATGPAPMQGGGFYNDHAQHQAKGGAHGLPLIDRAFEGMALHAPVTLADYGSATGRNSLVPMGLALGHVRRRLGPDVPVSVVHTDQPGNDFSALFALLRDDPESYLRRDARAFASAVGRTFHEQVLPDASVDFGWCSFAAHWMSRAPVMPAGHVWPRQAAPEVRAAFAAQAAADWEAFLAARARELKPGGALVVVQPSLPEDEPTTFPVLMAWVEAELDAMALGGMLTKDERGRMTILVFERTAADARSPFADGAFAGLTLVAEEAREMPDPFWPAYGLDGDAAALAEKHLGFFRAPFLPSLLAALDPGRDGAFREAFTAGLMEALGRRMRAAPQPLLSPMVILTGLYRKAGADPHVGAEKPAASATGTP
ncbi:hypothetical protein [Xanthobacter aminoxidans]|uniref:SAM-dependent methyltransferase n=1 Tax=Xanthobacter aminoxidans TaxID=186280 RepID=A0ABW6ZNX4_9HYPH